MGGVVVCDPLRRSFGLIGGCVMTSAYADAHLRAYMFVCVRKVLSPTMHLWRPALVRAWEDDVCLVSCRVVSCIHTVVTWPFKNASLSMRDKESLASVIACIKKCPFTRRRGVQVLLY